MDAHEETVIELNKLRALLHQNVVEVTFTKLDGTTRVLVGTTNGALIPPAPTREAPARQVNMPEDMVRVYDLEAPGWRSFHFDQVTAVEILEVVE